MNLITNKKYCHCHHCFKDIYSGDKKYVKRGKKFLCVSCGLKYKKKPSFMGWLLNKIK